MVATSCMNLLDLSGDILNFPQTPRALPRVMTVPGVISDIDGKQSTGDHDSQVFSSEHRQRIIIVANFLPLNAQKDEISGRWSFNYDEDSILLQLKDGISSDTDDTDVFYVGSLKVDVEESEQEKVSLELQEKFKCVPTFLPSDLQEQFYHGFCKQYLWPLFHYMLPMFPEYSNRFDRSLWQAYVSANKIFADKVMENINSEDDYVWVHDYHLMVLPTLLRKKIIRVKLGFFLHSPFPSSEIFRTLPVRDEILKALLNADLIGFHTFDYARHFLSCCSRMLGVGYESKRGYIGLEYFGRTIYIKILPVGIHMGRLQSALNHPSSPAKAREIYDRFKGKTLILGVDDMDIFKGISLKLLAVEKLLQCNPEMQGELSLVQIVNPPRSSGKNVEEAKKEIHIIAKRINERFSLPNYEPVTIIDHPLPFYEKTAYYALAECCIVSAVRDGMNLIPYKYIVCRQGNAKLDEALGIAFESPRTSALVVSEFIGCSPSLSGALRVNPWDINAVADAIDLAITMNIEDKRLRHKKHYRYVKSHDVAYWARSFQQDLVRACQDHYSKRCWGIGLGLSFRILALSPNFRKLSIDYIVSVYKRSSQRAIFLDYDGTIVPESSIVKSPSAEVISVLNNLCNDPDNTVFIVSGRGKTSLSEWFDQCENLGIAAEHGYFKRWSKQSSWETNHIATDFAWKRISEPVMRLYTEATDGSYIETKESALVWHYRDADPDFGSWQAKELLDHLESVLASEPVVVKKGQHIVEVKPQGITKGLVAEEVLSTLMQNGNSPDFVLCIGDDRSDEDMFESISNKVYGAATSLAPEIFACTVGQKPSKARYYLDDTVDVMKLLEGLGTASRTISRRSELVPFERKEACFENFA
ncbi:putative alpha,alpha-trehalose-phosphate synthase [UDP-forming] 9 [Senna tora]|uniref:alpha,alpha-trehalose-phosphate synthase (UDP-forming) n=1 Tax=Senna tora TaxID=362788 RepID=A0A834X6I9_9FABA|nr:putative alpha,alpha-trehalose-phosphate synthase [UDP-forming] 9 [Senna tora]